MFSDERTPVKVMHRKIVFVKVESSVHWSRRYYFYKRLKLNFYWDPKEQSTKRYPVYTRYPKKLVQYGRVRIEIKHKIPSYLEYTCYFSINRNNSLFLFPFSHDFSNYPTSFFFNNNLTYFNKTMYPLHAILLYKTFWRMYYIAFSYINL